MSTKTKTKTKTITKSSYSNKKRKKVDNNPNNVKLDQKHLPNSLSPFYSFTSHWRHLSRQYLCLSTWGTCCGGVNEQYDDLMDEEASIGIYKQHYIQQINDYLNNPPKYLTDDDQDTDDDNDNALYNNDNATYINNQQDDNTTNITNIIYQNTNNYNNVFNNNNNNNDNKDIDDDNYLIKNPICRKKCEQRDKAIKMLKEEIRTLKSQIKLEQNKNLLLNVDKIETQNQINKINDINKITQQNQIAKINEINRMNQMQLNKINKINQMNRMNVIKQNNMNDNANDNDDNDNDDDDNKKAVSFNSNALPAPSVLDNPPSRKDVIPGKSFGRKQNMFEQRIDLQKRKSQQEEEWFNTHHDDKKYHDDHSGDAHYVQQVTYHPAAHSVMPDVPRKYSAADYSKYMQDKEDPTAIVVNDTLFNLSNEAKKALIEKRVQDLKQQKQNDIQADNNNNVKVDVTVNDNDDNDDNDDDNSSSSSSDNGVVV